MRKFKRVFIYILGLFILAIGVNISKTASLGISPVSSVPYAMELVRGVELGKSTIMVHLILIGLQIILLRRDYRIKNLLQLLPAYLHGTFITYTSTDYLLFWLPVPTSYIVQFIYLIISIVIIGIGVALIVIPNIMSLPPEGLSQAIVDKSKGKIEFGNAKSAVDTSLVVLSTLISLIFLGNLGSVREGTILTALLCGKIVGYISKNYRSKITAWFEKGESGKVIVG